MTHVYWIIWSVLGRDALKKRGTKSLRFVTKSSRSTEWQESIVLFLENKKFSRFKILKQHGNGSCLVCNQDGGLHNFFYGGESRCDDKVKNFCPQRQQNK